jgi:hypothetical protein
MIRTIGNRAWDWEVRLSQWGIEHAGLPFAWGETDCASLVRDAMRVLYDRDVWESPTWYDSLASAYQTLQLVGGAPAWLLAHGATRMPLAFAQPSDVLVTPADPTDMADSLFVIVSHGRMLRTHPDELTKIVTTSRAIDTSYLIRLPYAW